MTRPPCSRGIALATALAVVPAGPVFATQAAVVVGVRVTLISTSGSCAAQQAQFGFDVACGRPVVVSSGAGVSMFGGLLATGRGSGSIGSPGAQPAAGQDASEGAQPGAANEGDVVGDMALPLRRGDGAFRYNAVEISSWRMVSSHNRNYVELTIAW